MKKKKATEIFVDNVSAIALAINPVFHKRSKYIDVRYHFIREQVKENEVEVLHVKTGDQVADIFTKPLKIDAFRKFKSLLGMIDGREFGLRGSVRN